MRSLLDVGVLIALFDADHVHHQAVHEWWAREAAGGWASSPLTQNGFVRILAQAGYARPATIAQSLTWLSLFMTSDHEFWPDDISIADATIFDHGRIAGPRQITDVYLLGLAAFHGGRFVTFDRSINSAAVLDHSPERLVIL